MSVVAKIPTHGIHCRLGNRSIGKSNLNCFFTCTIFGTLAPAFEEVSSTGKHVKKVHVLGMNVLQPGTPSILIG